MFFMREISNFSTSLKIENLNEIFKLKYIFKITIQSILVHCHLPCHFDNHVRMRPAGTAGLYKTAAMVGVSSEGSEGKTQ